MTNHPYLLLAALIFYANTTLATVLHWPDHCPSGQLNIENPSSSTVSFWVQKFNPTLSAETEFSIPAQGQMTLQLESLSAIERNSLIYFPQSPNQKMKAQLKCKDFSATATENEGGVQIFKAPSQTFYLKNLTNSENILSIEYLDSFFKPIHKVQQKLKPQEHGIFNTPAEEAAVKNAKYVQISGESKWMGYSVKSTSFQLPMIINPQLGIPATEGVFFEVAPRDNKGDSFIVSIKEASLIQKARDQISNPQLEKILFGKIKVGHQSINRNLRSLTKSYWSWSVSEVTNISDLASTSCNGFPQAVEDRLDSWVDDPGRICFWNYRIKRELSSSEVSTGQVPSP